MKKRASFLKNKKWNNENAVRCTAFFVDKKKVEYKMVEVRQIVLIYRKKLTKNTKI